MSKKIFFSVLLFFGGIGIFSPSLAFANLSMQAEQCDSSGCVEIPILSNQQIFSSPVEIGQELTLNISLRNTSGKPIYSVSSWLSYDPEILEVVRIDDTDSHFPLAAPGEFRADPSTRTIKIGRAVAGLPVTIPTANIAKITFRAKKNINGTKISFIDFRQNDVGKTAALTIQNMLPENILQKKPLDIIFDTTKSAPFGNTLGESSTTNTTPDTPNIYGVQNSYTQNPNNTGNINSQNNFSNSQNISQGLIGMPRPQGFRSRTYQDGKVEHLWKMGEDTRIRGYYIYYSSTSGRYMHRRDIGKTNNAVFPAGFFEKGKRIYFAIVAYDQTGKISDFSDETYVVIGTSGSESHPFFEQIFPNVDPNNAVIVKDANGNIIYKGTRKPGQNYSSNITTAKSQKNYPNPKNNVQSGMKISENFFFLFAGIFLILSPIILGRINRREKFSGP